MRYLFIYFIQNGLLCFAAAGGYSSAGGGGGGGGETCVCVFNIVSL